MSLLEFARGPGLYWATVIFVAGIVWRLIGALLAARKRDLSEPRASSTFGGLRTLLTRSVPNPELRRKAWFTILNAYVMHIGLFVVIFLFVPHILFFKSFLGFDWGGLPNNIVMLFGAVTVVTLLISLSYRLMHPVLRLISGFDDYFTWLITMVVLISGMMAFAHVVEPYQTLLAIHILSVELFMIWFPFGKLMHAILFIPSRMQLGKNMARRGVQV